MSYSKCKTASSNGRLLLSLKLGVFSLGLLALCTSIRFVVEASRSTILVASARGDVDQLLGFLNQGADVNERDPRTGATPLLLAASANREGAVRTLILRGALLNVKTKSGNTALMLAAEKNHIAVVRILLAAGADRKATNQRGSTARDLALRAGNSEIADIVNY
jgi:ankyrin repeat protein